MAAFIDPAQSFSNALNQGLGVFKSYRDEARQDEDRAFEKSMRQRMAEMQEKELQLLVNRDGREAKQFAADYSPTRIAAGDTQATALATEAVAKAKDAGVLADNRKRMIDTDINVALSNARSNRISASASATNAQTSRMEFGLRQRQYNDARAEQTRAKAFRDSFAFITQGAGNKNVTSQIAGNKVVAGSAMKMAAAAFDAPVLEEIVRDPYGNWMRDGKKLGVALRFASSNPIVTATAKAQGFRQGSVKLEQIRAANAFDPVTKTNQQVVEIRMTGIKPNGKRASYTGYVAPQKLFEPAAMMANVFGGIKRDPVARQRLAQVYAQADEEGFNMYLENEVNRIDKLLSSYGTSSTFRAEAEALRQRKAAIFNGDANVISDVVFESLGRSGSATL
jgi:hypothetical protein